MGFILFGAIAALEMILMVLGIRAKSGLTKARSITHIVLAAVFALLLLTSVIVWSFRYYALAALLSLQALAGAVQLIRKKEKRKTFSVLRAIGKAAGKIALLLLVALPAVIFPEYSIIPPTGKYQVATSVYTYTDAGRGEAYANPGQSRRLNVEFWHPRSQDETFPLIVFSHGGMSARTSNESLYHELASNGYVVCAIDHTYLCLYTTFDDGHTAYINGEYMRQLQAEDARADRQQSYEYYRQWMKIQTGDINFVTDHILANSRSEKAEGVYKLIDGTRIGVMGHSLGGSAALGIGRTRKDIGAVIALESPFLCDITGVQDGEFVFTGEPYPAPVLNVYSDSAWDHLAQWPQYAQNSRLLSQAFASAPFVHIRGTGHFSLTDLALTSPMLTRLFNGFPSTADTGYCLKTINQVCLQFFDCHLKETGSFTLGGTH